MGVEMLDLITAILAFAAIMIMLATLVTVLVESVQKVFRMRRAGLQQMLATRKIYKHGWFFWSAPRLVQLSAALGPLGVCAREWLVVVLFHSPRRWPHRSRRSLLVRHLPKGVPGPSSGASRRQIREFGSQGRDHYTSGSGLGSDDRRHWKAER
jgi:hypothetical protein